MESGISVPVPLSELRKIQQEMDAENSEDHGMSMTDSQGSRHGDRKDRPLDGKRETVTV